MNSKNIIMTAGSLVLVVLLITSICLSSPPGTDNHRPNNLSEPTSDIFTQNTITVNIGTPTDTDMHREHTETQDNTYSEKEHLTVDGTDSYVPSQTPNTKKIDLSTRSPYIGYSGLSEDAKTIIALMFEKIHTYNGSSSFVEVELPERFKTNLPEYLYYEVASFFSLYYGSYNNINEFFDVCKYTQNEPVTYSLELRMQTVRMSEAERARYIRSIESVLSEMNDGTETEVLNQVARWIARNYTYRAGTNTLSDFFDYHKANCNVVSMLFRLFAERLGIPCDVVVGYSSINGKYHAWNRVTLSDGSYRYYDITLYKSLNNSSYLCSTKALHNPVYINRYISRNALVTAFASDCAVENRDVMLLSDDKKKKKILLSIKENKL